METDNNRHNNGNSTEPNENTGHLGNHEPYGMSNKGNGLNDPSMDKDNYRGQERKAEDSSDADSKTFNEDEDTWKAKKEANTTNDGTKDNDWNAKDMTQRTIQQEQQDDDVLQGRYNDEEQNKYGQENDRRNREELE
ncbi:hypothetical protein [Flavobacterium sp.]|uniref:hypothetical protein n=1 Tax=Flavobacterium sp. TaxID=239 RepID=UPI0026314522|nr:hypothetical protein [Flavobacterium sp.]